ncbi:hypothetical protein ACJMK2_040880 [Sinanodonta woodiana]|uniref:Sushi domain-containing protein n=1 Tax=Sinanodonta woodiana TaxID=1069815 RepID=A0ABD3W2D2_SINWO
MTWQLFISIITCLYVVGRQYEYYGENVAYRKPANQSTTYQGYNASLGVDGLISTNFDDGTCSHTDVGQNYAWWTVDLEEFYFIKFIRIYHRNGQYYENRLHGSALYAKDKDNIWTQIHFNSTWPPNEFNVSVELNKPIGGIMLNNSFLQQGAVFICVCELEAFKVIECVHDFIENGNIVVVKYGDSNQTFTFGATVNVTCDEGYRMSDDGVLTNETESTIECNVSGNWTRNLTCSVILCGSPPNIPSNSKEIITPGLAGNNTYNATITVECIEGYNYSLHEIKPLRCTSDGVWTGHLGNCNGK